MKSSLFPLIFGLLLFSSQRLLSQRVIIENGFIMIDCSDMPDYAVTRTSKGSGSGAVSSPSEDGKGISTNGATVYIKFQVAKEDAKISDTNNNYKMIWSDAIGYSIPYTGSYPSDPRIGISAGSFNSVYPTNTQMRGAPANAQTGCNAYSEGNASSTGKGKWRLPNKRELMLMWIYRTQLENIEGFRPFNTDTAYWSASERLKNLAHPVSMMNGISTPTSKTTGCYVRCIREIP